MSNLKIVLDQGLLAQPAFFEDEVLRALFNTNDEYPISDIWIRLLEEDYTLPVSVSP